MSNILDKIHIVFNCSFLLISDLTDIINTKFTGNIVDSFSIENSGGTHDFTTWSSYGVYLIWGYKNYSATAGYTQAYLTYCPNGYWNGAAAINLGNNGTNLFTLSGKTVTASTTGVNIRVIRLA